MKPRPSTRSGQRFFLWTVSLVAALLAVSCAPSATTETTPPEASQPGVMAPATQTPALTEAPAPTAAPTVLPVATSRGPNLEATNPATVSLASGGLQLVEFFRFT